MKRLLLLATAYPYTTGIVAIIWLGSVILLKIDPTLPANTVVVVNSMLTLLIASIGFRR